MKRSTYNESLISHKYLVSTLNYCPNTGIFTWKDSGKPARNGSRAGTTVRGPNGKTYRQIRLNGILYYEHRLAFFYMFKTWPETIDHIDRDAGNNRISNLRNVTHAENMKNKRPSGRNKSGQIGVSETANGKFIVTIGVNGKSKYLGTFDNFSVAVSVRKGAEKAFGFHSSHGNVEPLSSILTNH